jgi:hypothetical protein
MYSGNPKFSLFLEKWKISEAYSNRTRILFVFAVRFDISNLCKYKHPGLAHSDQHTQQFDERSLTNEMEQMLLIFVEVLKHVTKTIMS